MYISTVHVVVHTYIQDVVVLYVKADFFSNLKTLATLLGQGGGKIST